MISERVLEKEEKRFKKMFRNERTPHQNEMRDKGMIQLILYKV